MSECGPDCTHPSLKHIAEPKLRPCTCHPDDKPPVPCAEKYAFSECVEAAMTQRKAKRRAGIPGW